LEGVGEKMQEKLKQLTALGQSIWLDNLKRSFITSGQFNRWINQYYVTGVTSNPTIFAKAIESDTDYDNALKKIPPNLNAEQIFEELATQDIQNTCDILLQVYKSTDAKDGYVSFEVSPHFAYDSDTTVKEAMRLWKKINRPNLMIKVPATKQGVQASYRLLTRGININCTLLFSVERYKQIIEAYLDALTERVNKNLQIANLSSVASFFVSRVDTKTDAILENFAKNANEEKAKKALALRGKIAVANSKLAYKVYRKASGGSDFANLAKFKAQKQRLLWASTSTKNPNYSPVLYVDELIGPDTVNTMPEETLQYFANRGNPKTTVDQNLKEAQNQIATLKDFGIDINKITQELEKEGVEKFASSHDELLKTIENKTLSVRR
jgi:transaldolase